MFKMTIALTLISCTAALLIAFTNAKTGDSIAKQQAVEQQNALQLVLPRGVTAEKCRFLLSAYEDSVTYWMAPAGDDTVYAFKIGCRGYSSTIHFLVCIDIFGKIIGMTVLDQNETPGLGSRVQEVLSKRNFWNGLATAKEIATPWFSDQFRGISVAQPIEIDKSVGEWHSLGQNVRTSLIKKNSVTAITGSTISTRAVTVGLNNKAMSYLKAIRG